MDLDKRLATAGMSTSSQTPETGKTPAKARTRAKVGTPTKQKNGGPSSASGISGTAGPTSAEKVY